MRRRWSRRARVRRWRLRRWWKRSCSRNSARGGWVVLPFCDSEGNQCPHAKESRLLQHLLSWVVGWGGGGFITRDLVSVACLRTSTMTCPNCSLEARDILPRKTNWIVTVILLKLKPECILNPIWQQFWLYSWLWSISKWFDFCHSIGHDSSSRGLGPASFLRISAPSWVC